MALNFKYRIQVCERISSMLGTWRKLNKATSNKKARFGSNTVAFLTLDSLKSVVRCHAYSVYDTLKLQWCSICSDGHAQRKALPAGWWRHVAQWVYDAGSTKVQTSSTARFVFLLCSILRSGTGVAEPVYRLRPLRQQNEVQWLGWRQRSAPSLVWTPSGWVRARQAGLHLACLSVSSKNYSNYAEMFNFGDPTQHGVTGGRERRLNKKIVTKKGNKHHSFFLTIVVNDIKH